VNAEAYAQGALTLGPLDAEDEVIVRQLIEKHFEETDSPKARELLSTWDESASRFTKVLPAQYARVKAALAVLNAAGGDLMAPGAWTEFMEVTHG
jgi:glutamate synthase (NADPH/NADH) large chain